jgi:hypothetical protein
MTNNTLATTDGPTWAALKATYRAADAAAYAAEMTGGDVEQADHEAEMILREIDKAFGGDPMETDSFMLTCCENPPVVELVDEQGRHVGWENAAQVQEAA